MNGGLLVQPDTRFLQDLLAAGGGDVKKCYQCATCAATCDLSTVAAPFPRPQMLAAQWGLRDKLLADPGPWLCFYCGECSQRCPRKANPGETMMALRRYLTSQYDWTGLSALMYRSAFWELGVLALVSLAVVLLFTLPQSFGFGLLAHASPDALRTVMLGSFAPTHVVHLADTILAVSLGLLLLSNAARMFRSLTRGREIPARQYLRALPRLVADGITQRRWRDCREDDARRNWLRHVLLVSGYGTIFTLVVVFLPWFQAEDSGFRWTGLLGYYSTVVLLWSAGSILIDRLRKRTEAHRFSHLSDWLFPILLFLTAFTGILLHIVRMANQPMPTYTIYMIHLAVAVPMLVVEVPFGKWAHLLYRPLALYVAAVATEWEGVSGHKA